MEKDNEKRRRKSIRRTLMICCGLFSFFVLIESCCKMRVNTIKCEGISGTPKVLQFLNTLDGIVLCNDGDLYTDAKAIICKTSDGGRKWNALHTIEGFIFTDKAAVYKEKIYCIITKSSNLSNNYILRYDCEKDSYTIIDFNIESYGDIWADNGFIYCNYYSNHSRHVIKLDDSTLKYNSKSFNWVAKTNGIISEKNNLYFITHSNEFMSICDSNVNEISIIRPQSIAKTNQNIILISANTNNKTITLYEYCQEKNSLFNTCSFEGYDVASDFKINNETAVLFLGYKKNTILKYDIVCRSSSKKEWHKIPIASMNIISPSCVADNYCYIFTSNCRINKIKIE